MTKNGHNKVHWWRSKTQRACSKRSLSTNYSFNCPLRLSDKNQQLHRCGLHCISPVSCTVNNGFLTPPSASFLCMLLKIESQIACLPIAHCISTASLPVHVCHFLSWWMSQWILANLLSWPFRDMSLQPSFPLQLQHHPCFSSSSWSSCWL